MTHEHVSVNELMMRLNLVKRMDMKTSVEIAGIANCLTRDVNGNLLPFVWTRQIVYNEYENATLLTRDSLQKHLQTFIDPDVRDNVDILQKVEDPAVFVDWVVRISEYWERGYVLKRDEKYSQTVFSAMFEIVNTSQIWLLLQVKGMKQVQDRMNVKKAKLSVDPGQNRFYRRLVEYISETPNEATALESHFWLHRGTNAIVCSCSAARKYRSYANACEDDVCWRGSCCRKKKSVTSQGRTPRSDKAQTWCKSIATPHTSSENC
jgi:hypothetical protein